MNGKIKLESSMSDIISIMSEYNDIAAEVVLKLLLNHDNETGVLNLIFLDNKDIRGERLAKLYDICCLHDFDKFVKTIEVLKYGQFLYEEIIENLDSLNPLPFIDDYDLVTNLDKKYYLEIRKRYLEKLKKYRNLNIEEIKKDIRKEEKHL